ncbi:MAG TPA: FhaA domain-containing protein [Ktedonobacterales bacterium]|jgi:hypothetical protein
MGVFSKFDALVRGVVEGAANLIVPARLQEQEVLDALRQFMDEHLQDDLSGRQIAPHRLVARLNPADRDRLTRRTPALDERLALDLRRIANAQRYLLTGALQVYLNADPKIPAGRVVCEELPDNALAADPINGGDSTMTIDASAVPQPQAPTQIPPAWLTLLEPSRGQPMLLNRPEIHIGRHNTNDIIINERRVSRFHAEVRFDRGQFMLRDLSSVNGVLLNGAPIRRDVALQDRDIVGICGYKFIFQRR